MIKRETTARRGIGVGGCDGSSDEGKTVVALSESWLSLLSSRSDRPRAPEERQGAHATNFHARGYRVSPS